MSVPDAARTQRTRQRGGCARGAGSILDEPGVGDAAGGCERPGEGGLGRHGCGYVRGGGCVWWCFDRSPRGGRGMWRWMRVCWRRRKAVDAEGSSWWWCTQRRRGSGSARGRFGVLGVRRRPVMKQEGRVDSVACVCLVLAVGGCDGGWRMAGIFDGRFDSLRAPRWTTHHPLKRRLGCVGPAAASQPPVLWVARRPRPNPR